MGCSDNFSSVSFFFVAEVSRAFFLQEFGKALHGAEGRAEIVGDGVVEHFEVAIGEFEFLLALRELEIRGLKASSGLFEELPALFGYFDRVDHRKDFRNQGKKRDGGDGRSGGGDRLHVAREPIDGFPDGPNLHEVSEAAGDDENAKGEKHPVKRDVPAGLPNEIAQRAGNRNVGESDHQVGNHVQADQVRILEITGGVR